MFGEVRVLADSIARFDRDHARQLRRSSLSVVNNIAEGSGGRGGTRTARYCDAIGSARETLAGLEAAEVAQYISIDPALRERFKHIIGTLVKIVY